MKVIKDFEGRGLERKVSGEQSVEDVFGQITRIFKEEKLLDKKNETQPEP